MYLETISLVILSTLLIENRADNDTESIESILSEKYDSYGEDWIFIPDGDNNPQVAVLKGEGVESRLFSEDVPPEFWLYTKTHMDEGIQLFYNDSKSIKNSDFSPGRETKYITHGWKSSIYSAGPKGLKDAYLKEEEDYNVIMINWEYLADNTFYIVPMKNTEQIGIHAANFIDFLADTTGAALDKMHVVGHSLGGHVSGVIGSSVKRGKLGRITGLDPALPGFGGLADVNKRLDKTDASFVDVIHTCGGVLGFLHPIGHADFYPNGGIPVQNGCCCLAEMMEACSHGRAWVYFTESVTSPEGFLATKCSAWGDYIIENCANESTAFMGEFVDRTIEGLYFLSTKSKAPFAIGIKSLTNDQCDEPGGWKTDDDNTRICGTNSI